MKKEELEIELNEHKFYHFTGILKHRRIAIHLENFEERYNEELKVSFLSINHFDKDL
jgi:hypothetical protein